jgi:ABC-type amino acid transport substrate-binding protein
VTTGDAEPPVQVPPELTPWWHREAAIVAALIIFFPLGLSLMWYYAPWSRPRKRLITFVSPLGALLILGLVVVAAGGLPSRGVIFDLVTTNIWIGALLVLAGSSIAVLLVTLARRHAPVGGFFSDSDRAAAIFSAIGTMFSVLLALVIFLSVETYTTTNSHANAEADSVLQQGQLARLFPSRDQYSVQSQLICYGRSVIEQEWPIMRHFGYSAVVNHWSAAIDSTIDSVEIRGPKAEAGFQLFLSQTLQRQEERRGRLEGAEGALPETVWPILFLGALAVAAGMIAYADKGERLYSQIFQVGIVTILLGSSLLLISALNHPFGASPGKIEPDKMRLAVELMQRSLSESVDSPDLEATLPCDLYGQVKATEPEPKDFRLGSTMDQIVQRGQLVLGVTHSLTLFGELDPVSGRVSGFDIDIGREIARELGLRQDQIVFVDTLISDRIPALQEDRVDLVVLAMTITPERQELVDFSRPYYVAGQSILVLRHSRTISGLRDLAGKRVCSVPESTSAATIAELVPRADLNLRDSFPLCVAALKSGSVDAVVTDDIVLAGFASEEDDLVLVGGQFTTERYGVAIPKGQADMVEFVDSVIERMILDGRWGKIYYEYLADVPGLPSVSEAKKKLSAQD